MNPGAWPGSGTSARLSVITVDHQRAIAQRVVNLGVGELGVEGEPAEPVEYVSEGHQ